MTLRVLLVDDDRDFSSLAAAALRREGFAVAVARSLHEARVALAKDSPGLVVLDRRLPDGDGLALLAELRAQMPTAAVLVVTAYGDITNAVAAMRQGASDYLIKPVELADLVLKARAAQGTQRLRDRLSEAEKELAGRRRLLPPRSPKMRALVEMLERIAAGPKSAVLLLGETGSGKEVLARHLHALAHGAEAPFVHINCAALPESMVESELFGHERGAFTSAQGAKRGLVEVASGGTLFLDEVGDLPLPVQAKLLTFLDAGTYRRLGSETEQVSAARVVAATNRDLGRAVAEGRFREDLWFRLGTFRLDVPPLRDRREDVVPMAEALLADLCAELARAPMPLSPRARARLEGYAFPGNARELRSILERALVLEAGPALELALLDAGAPGRPRDADAFEITAPPVPLDELERRYVRWALERLGGRRVETAKALGISYPTLQKRLEEE